ncbi:MAG: DinB family protein [Phycisphaerales bacterium]
MAVTQPAGILLDHDRWAMHALFDACAPLPDEQLDRAFDMGLGTLRKTIIHILGAKQAWTDILHERPVRDRLEDDAPRSIAELRALHDAIADEFDAIATAHPPDGTVDAERRGQSYTFVRGHILTHVCTHGVHHRAQCQNMLRHLGVEKLPMSSVVEWALFGPGARF